MKRTLIAAAAVLAAGTAFAQSSVQIYGRVNTSVERQKDSGVTSSSVTALQNNASRWGLRGTEDLGGGLKALFVLESGFSSDTGAGQSRLFGRESWVGVEGNFGRVRLGNMGQTAAYYTTADYISMHNHDTGTSEDKFYLYPGRKQNMISYNTPSFGGLVVEAQYSFKQTATFAETSDSTTGENTALIAANFDRGPLHLGASYLRGPIDFSANGRSTAAGADIPLTVAGVAGATVNDGKQFGVRGLYELGPVTVGAYFVRDEADNAFGGEFKRNSYRVSAMYTMGAAELHANVGYAAKIKVGGAKLDDTSALQYTLAANYNLSKRTKVYAFYTRVNNDSRINYYAPAAGSDFSSIALGVRHNF